MMKYIDIGLNLFCRQFRDPERIISDAAEAGVACILTGSDMKENEKVQAFVQQHPEVWGTCGIHPHSADGARPADFDRIREIVSSNANIVAVGECGLDYDRMFSTRENQLRCFDRHIRLAEELEKPLFLHERAASKDFIARMKQHPEQCRRSVVHCFTGDAQTLKTYLDMGFYIGITGWICDDRRGGALREAVKLIPADRVMIETDAPYLTPKNVKGLGNVNVPQNVKYVAAELAKYMKTDEAALTKQLLENTKRLFRL
ncbi:MAG: TatD family hydrolase [Oscillospiraceae bacterium]|nr:TatD family hydrolase [Oscillospiraceae bacterium]